MKVLIAEDEIQVARAIKVFLDRNKITSDMVHDGRSALDYLMQVNYDVIVLDIMMPEMDGVTVLKKARAQGIQTPVLFLTAKSGVDDRVSGLEAGADDYLVKPFDMNELVARVRALSRRSMSYAPSIIDINGTKLNCSSFELSCGGESVKLNNKEFQLMELFMKYPGQVFSADHIMDRIWSESAADIDVLWTYMGFIRKKLKKINATVAIKTVRGAGYSLEGL
ncbi:MAG: response regulator transcription factor [Lachnospiraceae bacterium]|nr:response regulator transcription factor [Lachnospiraceae bacterium]